MNDFAEFVFSKLPLKYQEYLRRESSYAGFEKSLELFVFWIFAVFWFLIVFEAVAMIIMGPPIWLALAPIALLFLIGFSAPYLIFSISADSRKKDMDEVLPDFLLLVAANIKSGLTIDRAILFSARPEFGELSREFKKVAFEIYGGESLEYSFSKIVKRIKSGALERTVSLLVEGVKSGGDVAKLLEETAIDIRNTEILQKEIRASVMMYVMFIFMAAVLGAPALFAISTFLIRGTMSMWSGMDTSSMSGMETGMIKISPPSIDITVFGYFATAAIIITTTFSGILISLIQTGTIRQGIKYSPLFTSVALVIYFVAKELLFRIFGGMLGVAG